jgi:hypothetical protein
MKINILKKGILTLAGGALLSLSGYSQIGPAIDQDFVATKTRTNWDVNNKTVGGTIAVASTISQNATTGVITISPSKNTSDPAKYRGDFVYATGPAGQVKFNPTTYPIVAIKFTKPSTGNLTFDIGSVGDYRKPGSGTQNNQQTALNGYSNIYYYDLGAAGAKLGATKEINETNFTYPIEGTALSFKIADLTIYETYDIYWVKSFASVAALTAYVESTLPVSLTYYQVKLLQNGYVDVNWKVASENNNSYFVVERKADEGNFNKLEKIPSKGNGKSDYFFIDKNPQAGTNYYRLSQVDKDGTKKELGIQSVNHSLDTGNDLTIYPLPVTGNSLYFNYLSNNKVVSVSITSLAGKKILEQTLAVELNGVYKVQLINKPVTGIYLLTIDGKQSQKILIN